MSTTATSGETVLDETVVKALGNLQLEPTLLDEQDPFLNSSDTFTNEDLALALHSFLPAEQQQQQPDEETSTATVFGLEQTFHELPDLYAPRRIGDILEDSDEEEEQNTEEEPFLNRPLGDLENLLLDDDDNNVNPQEAERKLAAEAQDFQGADDNSGALGLLDQLDKLTLDLDPKATGETSSKGDREPREEEDGLLSPIAEGATTANDVSGNNEELFSPEFDQALIEQGYLRPPLPYDPTLVDPYYYPPGELPPFCLPCDPELAETPLPTIVPDAAGTLPPHCQPCNPDLAEDPLPSGAELLQDPWNIPYMDDQRFQQYAMENQINPAMAVPEKKPPPYIPRDMAFQEARKLAQAFGVTTKEQQDEASFVSEEKKPPKSTERALYGHKERIMGLDLSECGTYLATASQDSTVRIWNVAKNKLLATLTDHSTKHECLRVAWASSAWGEDMMDRSPAVVRLDDDDKGTDDEKAPFAYMLATGGADGWVHVYGCSDPSSWTRYASLDHSQLSHFAATQDEEDKPQIYSLQFIDDWKAGGEDGVSKSFLMTSSDDHVHLWDFDTQKKARAGDSSTDKKMHLREVLSIRFSDMHTAGYGVSVGQTSGIPGLPPTIKPEEHIGVQEDNKEGEGPTYRFGGIRNPQNLVYVFDAAYCQANGLLGAALSDGTLRIVNSRGICISLFQLPGVNAHLTSFCWDSTGTRLATCVGTGHIITWGLEKVGSNPADDTVRPSCSGIFEGGHEIGRPLFGVRYWQSPGRNDDSEDVLISWGIDGRVCVWDSRADEEVDEPLAVLVEKSDYPIFAADMVSNGVIAVAGGGSEGGFVGIPAYLYKVPDPADEESKAGPSKKSKPSVDGD